LSITVLRDLTLKELLVRLRNLPPHTIVFFATGYFQDASKNYFLPEDVLELIARSSNAPVYGTNEPYIGHGILGGNLYNMAEPGQAVGVIGARILAGEKVTDIPVQTINPSHLMVDARQLRRWGIAESRLPPGTMIRFKQQSTWELYRWYFLAVVFLVLLQSLLIVALVVQGRRLRHSETTLKDLSRHLINAQEDERKRIARELHDDFGQRLALLKIELEMLSQDNAHVQRLSGREPLQNLLANVADLARDIQDLSHRLHSSKLQYIGLKGALRDLGRQISKQHQISIDLRTSDLTYPVPDETALCFYRVAQEALHNAAKHSGASQVVVAVSGKKALLKMRITDNGHGFDQAETSLGLGLASMRERLQMIGGNLEVVSRPGGGTRLTAEAPLQESFEQAKAG
jgi:signal transduction histidine kinase